MPKMPHNDSSTKKVRGTGKNGYFMLESEGKWFVEKIYDPEEIVRIGFKRAPHDRETLEMEIDD